MTDHRPLHKKQEEQSMTDQEAIQFLQDIVRIRTENDNETEVAEYIRDLLARHGIESTLV